MKNVLFLLMSLFWLSSCDVLQQTMNNGTNNGGLQGPVPGYVGRIGCDMPMNGNQFATFHSTLNSYQYESQREEMGVQMIAGKCFTVNQVRSLANLFSFDSTRLKMLKKLYHHAYDLDNYTQLIDMLQFPSSREELHKYILAQP